MSSSDDFLVASNLHKAFGHIVAVDDVSFSIRRKEIFGAAGAERGRQDDDDTDAFDGSES